VCASIHEFHPNAAVGVDVPIGRPLANTAIYVLDSQLEPLPIGVPGEICIAGAGLAREYINDPDQTAHSFVHWQRNGGIRIYRTGDRGWWAPNGELVFGGRFDDQVKVRGYRIEPAEIIRALDACTGVDQALVVPRGDNPSTRHLVAYLRRRPDSETVATSTLRAELSRKIPHSMIPAHFVWLDQFPLNSNGKIDKRALPDPEPQTSGNDPQTPMEAELAAIWKRVLRLASVGINDHFFELGGDSIKLLQTASELQKIGIRVEPTDLYRYPTIASLAAHAHQRESDIDQRPVAGIAPLTATQAWFFSTYRGNRNHFNQSVLLQARTRLQEESLRAALHTLVQHHDALRTRFRWNGDTMLQEFLETVPDKFLEVIDLSSSRDEHHEMESHANRLQRSLDVEEGRLIAAILFRGKDRDFVFIVVHHLVIDGVSWRILMQDLSAGLQRKPFPSKTYSVKHWAEQQHFCTERSSLLDELPYWENHTSLKSGPDRAGDRATLHFELEPNETKTLLTQPRTDAVLLTALARAFHEWDGRHEIVVTLEGHGREEIVEGIDVSRTVGWFTSMYPVKLDLSNSVTIDDQLVSVARTLEAVPNRGIGYGMLTYLRNSTASQTGISFNYLGQLDAAMEGDIFEESFSNLGDSVDPDSQSVHELDLLARVTGGAFRLDLSYSPRRYSQQQAEALLDAFRAALQQLIASSSPLPVPAGVARMRPYGGQRVSGLPLLLNREQPHKIFAMPPLFGYGIAFQSLANHIENHAFHSFDFIEDDHRVAEYARHISAVRGGGRCVLLGYSGGGNLAFEVAKELQRLGRPISDLILLDVPLRRRVIQMSDEEIQAMMDGNLGYFRTRMEADPEYRVFVTSPHMRPVMLRKMESFIRYLNELVNTGRIDGGIHLIRSAQEWAEPADWDDWAKHTSGELRRYQGVGEHASMTDDANVDANAAIINRILADRAS
jgi:non-ribosomal peptide synthase protein (TIGR01720 family)